MGKEISRESASSGQALSEVNPQMVNRPARREPYREKAEFIERVGNKLAVRWTNPTSEQAAEFLMPFAGRIWKL